MKTLIPAAEDATLYIVPRSKPRRYVVMLNVETTYLVDNLERDSTLSIADQIHYALAALAIALGKNARTKQGGKRNQEKSRQPKTVQQIMEKMTHDQKEKI